METEQERLEDNVKYYYAVKNLYDASCFFLNINFEVLRGCTYNCTGCFVKRSLNDAYLPEYVEQLPCLIDEFKEKGGAVPHIAFIGPTDFSVADNTVDLLSDKNMQNTLRRFRRLSFISVLRNLDNAKDVADVWNRYYSDKELEINVAFEPLEIHKPEYVEMLQENRDKLFSMFKSSGKIRTFAVFNVFDYQEYGSLAHLDYEQMHKTIKHLFETTIDFNFSLLRRHTLPREDLLRDLITVKSMFNDSVNDGTKTFLRFSFGKLNDALIEKQFNFRQGKFFLSPLLYERAVDFSERFEVKKKGLEYCFNDFVEAEKRVIIDQYNYVDKTTECSTCPYLGVCTDRMILSLYEQYELKDCYVAKDALDSINKISNRNVFIQ